MKSITCISINSEILKAIKLKTTNLSKLIEDFLKKYLSSFDTCIREEGTLREQEEKLSNELSLIQIKLKEIQNNKPKTYTNEWGTEVEQQ